MSTLQSENFTFSQIIKSKAQVCAIEGLSGCAKTEVYLQRIHALYEEGIPYSQMLNIAGSRYKIKSNTIRFKQKWSEEEKYPSFITLYSFCYQLIKKYNAQHDIETWKAYKDLGSIVMRLVKKHFNLDLSFEECECIMSKIALSKTSMMSEKEIQAIRIPNIDIDFAYLFKQYEKEKERLKIYDFEDLLVHAFQLLSTTSLASLCSNIQYIHVDDAQELPFLAHLILHRLVNNEKQLHLFYDEHQQLSLRHAADLQPLQALESTYASVERFELKTNYRNAPAILSLAESFYFHKDMEETQEIEKDVCFYKGFQTETELYAYAEEKAKASQGKCLFLARNKEMLLPLMDLFVKNEINFQCPSIKYFFKYSFITDMMHFFDLLTDPRNLLALEAISSKLNIKCSEKTYQSIAEQLSQNDDFDVYQAIMNANVKAEIKNGIRKYIENFRMIQNASSLAMFQFVLQKLEYRRFLIQENISLSHPAMVAFQALCERYTDPKDVTTCLRTLASATYPDTARIILDSIDTCEIEECSEVYVMDMQQSLFPLTEEDTERKRLYLAMMKAQDHLEFLFAKRVGNTRLRPSSFLLELFKKPEKENVAPQNVERQAPALPRRGRKIMHESLGEGTILKLDNHLATIRFANQNERTLNLTFCLNNGLAKLL